MCEILQANVLIEKFLPSWSDYRNELKHKKKDLTLQELISHIRTEEANRLKDKIHSLSLNSSKANLVESTMPTNRDRFKGKVKKNKKSSYSKQQNKFCNKFKQPKGLCYACNKPGHKAYQCPLRKGQSQPNRKPVAQANLPKTQKSSTQCSKRQIW